MEFFWKGAPACSRVLVQLTYTGMDQSTSWLCVQMPVLAKAPFLLPHFKYFLYLDPLVTSEPGAFQGLLKKYFLFPGGIYFRGIGKLLVSSVQCKIKDRSSIQLMECV